MGKTSTKLAAYALVQLLLFHFSGLVAAVDFYFHARVDTCAGPSYMYRNSPPNSCATSVGAPAGSVRVGAMFDQVIAFYEGGGCCNRRSRRRGRGCAVGGGYTGAMWRPIPILADAAEKGCDAQAKATGIAYSEESTEGRWILTTDNATEMYTQMDTIPDAQKVDWLQAHGATFEPGL